MNTIITHHFGTSGLLINYRGTLRLLLLLMWGSPCHKVRLQSQDCGIRPKVLLLLQPWIMHYSSWRWHLAAAMLRCHVLRRTGHVSDSAHSSIAGSVLVLRSWLLLILRPVESLSHDTSSTSQACLCSLRFPCTHLLVMIALDLLWVLLIGVQCISSWHHWLDHVYDLRVYSFRVLPYTFVIVIDFINWRNHDLRIISTSRSASSLKASGVVASLAH